MGYLMLFSTRSNIKPSTYYTSADEQVAEVLYSLQNDLASDVGQIVWLEMLDAGVSLSRILPFPCLITEMCRNAGVPIGDLTKPPKDFKKKQYTIQVNASLKLHQRRRDHSDDWVRGVTEVDSSSSSEGEYQDPDYDPSAPHKQAEMPPQMPQPLQFDEGTPHTYYSFVSR